MGNGIKRMCCINVSKEKKTTRSFIKADKLPILKTKLHLQLIDIKSVFVFKGTIGKGYFSTVKMASKISEENANYAIKIVKKEKVKKSKHADFMNELTILESLDHPNIIKTLEVYEDNTKFYLVMEYLSGEDIFQRILAEKILRESFIAEILYKLISAVNHCHSVGICHRDIKPANILCNIEKGIVKLIDFGVSKNMKLRGRY